MWWIVLLRAVVALVLGLVVLLSEKTKPALGNFIAVYRLLGSVLTLRWVLWGLVGGTILLLDAFALRGVAER